MNEGKVKAAFVQGTVKFEVSCNELMGIVPAELADRERDLKEWLIDSAMDLIDKAHVSVEIDNDDRMELTEKTANKYLNEIISDSDWSLIREERENGSK